MGAIYKKELQSYFTTPIGYICLGVFLFFFNMFFVQMILNLSSDVTNLFAGGNIMFMLLFVPILTMRLFSEERKTKTEQILLTSPVSLTGIVLGKFFAAFTLYAIGLALTIPDMVILFIYGTPGFWVVVGNYFGMLLLGALMIAIGVFISALTENQIIACILSFAVLFMLYLIDFLIVLIPFDWVSTIIVWASVYKRYSDFTQGIFNPAAVIYYCSITAVFIFLTVRAMEKRRWS
ncbi:MAG: ABC transporter [Ruminococcaceae bacterium]|nr:ABC transporter [Oscillospiraceae bacterium]